MKEKNSPKIINILDTFCGAGGSSTGAVFAAEELGYQPALTCVNHNEMAIATHTINHPWARHYCTGIDDLNLSSMYGDTLLDVLWSSPSCTTFSTAKGGNPINEQDRATGWCVVRIADTLQPPIILVENVGAYLKWGPIQREWCAKRKIWVSYPNKKREGETFQAWCNALRSLGYKVDHRILCCANYGDPTTRERLFIQCVRGKRKIVWPNPTHASPKDIETFKDDLFKTQTSSRIPWVPARDIIDWTLQGTSIFDREKTLVEKTLRRIFLGLDRIGLKSFQKEETYIENRHAIISPELFPIKGKEYIVHQMGQSIAEDSSHPLSTVVGGPKHYISEPHLIKLRNTNTTSSLSNPSPTITAGGTHLGLAQAQISALLPQHTLGQLRKDDEPTPTVAGAGAIALVQMQTTSVSNVKRKTKNQTTTQKNTKPKRVDPTLKALVEKVLKENQTKQFTFNGLWLALNPESQSNPQWRPIIHIENQEYLLEIHFRMLQPHELAAAQGFPKDYEFKGTKTQVIKQIGNAVPCNTARALVKAALTQNPEVGLPQYDWLQKSKSLTYALIDAHGKTPEPMAA